MNGTQQEGESIRCWYDRTTSKARKILVWTSLVAVVGGVFFFILAPFKLAAFMQTANGAVTIPVAGGIWIASFVYIFLIPNREVGFRSQEAIEEAVGFIEDSVEKKIAPTVEIWRRIGERVEKELNGGLPGELRNAVKEVKDAVVRVERSAENSNGELRRFADDARPALETLKRIQARMEKEIGSGLVDEIRAAAGAVRQLQPPPVSPTEPDLDKALRAVSKKRPPAPAAARTPEPAAAPPAVPSPEAKATTDGNGGPS